ncbi:hypothetical protein ABIF68_010326 [Bradyrhizobium japonicum]|uniref:hypothetical protein n=1 Tax=Bradyrhizobium japonicum TaxID=375 RepID=UPI0004B9275E|nr:hypothetical protein [Bradyrhizobium japonicum]
MSEQESTETRSEEAVSTFRVLTRQPLSLDVGDGVHELDIQNVTCRIAVTPAHSDIAKRKELGGTTIAIEFQSDPDLDLMEAARVGYELVEDFLSAITVVSGATFGPSQLLQVARLDEAEGQNCEFVIFLPLPLKHWHETISGDKLKFVCGLLAHWDGLESGHRLRRAARLYRTAAGNPDEITAFQEAYIGLEVLEKPLASMAGFAKHGTEQVKGKCEKCGYEFTRNKTTLVGVRAFVHGSVDLDAADSDRKADWKLLNKLRNDLTHGLVDEHELGEKPHRGLTAAMHYLHHAICMCSHAPSLTNSRYVLARGGIDYVLVGRYHVAEWPSLAEWGQVVDTSMFAWVEHATHGLVPEMTFNVRGIKDLEVFVGRLKKPTSLAMMVDIADTPIERD